jgi:hypothetical protein
LQKNNLNYLMNGGKLGTNNIKYIYIITKL